MGPINLSRAALPAAVLFIFLSIPALAQDTQARSKPRFHGFALKVHGVKTSPWTWTRFGGAFQARQAGGLGLNVSYAPVPSLAAYVAADLLVVASEYLTGWTTYEAGAQMRLPLHPLLMPYTSVGLGHLSSLNNFPGYNFATFGVGVEFFALRRLALHYEAQLGLPLGNGTWQGQSVPLLSNYRRQFLGLSLYLGAAR